MFDISLWSSLLTFAILMAGVVVTLYAGWVDKNKGKVIAGFAILGVVGLTLEHFQGEEDAAAELALATTIKELGVSSKEQGELSRKSNEAQARSEQAQAEAVKLQASNLDLSAENRKLVGETLQRVIGDPDNPPYVEVDNARIASGEFELRLYIVNPSTTYPAKDVVTDLMANGMAITSTSQSIPPSARVALSVPNTSGMDSAYVRVTALSEIGSTARMAIDISCNAGLYTQHIGLVRAGETAVLQSTHVVRRGETQSILSASDKGFPKDFNKWPKELKIANR